MIGNGTYIVSGCNQQSCIGMASAVHRDREDTRPLNYALKSSTHAVRMSGRSILFRKYAIIRIRNKEQDKTVIFSAILVI